MVEFHQQSPKLLVERYEHMDSRNERLMMRLKLIQEKYYFMEN